jgi:SAM-dependent methyltransferase
LFKAEYSTLEVIEEYLKSADGSYLRPPSGNREGFYAAVLSAGKTLPRDAIVLDVGCGVGRTVLDYSLRCLDGLVVGLDHVYSMLKLARQVVVGDQPVPLLCKTDMRQHEIRELLGFGRNTVALVAADAQRLPFADALFDCVLGNYIYSIIDDYPSALRETVRLVKPGGMLIVTNGYSWEELREPERRHNPDDLNAVLRGAGMQIELDLDFANLNTANPRLVYLRTPRLTLARKGTSGLSDAQSQAYLHGSEVSMSEQYQAWRETVLADVQQEYPDADAVTKGETTGNRIIGIAPGRIFKVLSPERVAFLPYERRLWAALEEACGPDCRGLFVPQRAVTIGGREGFESQRFESTLLDIMLDPNITMDEWVDRMRGGFDAPFALLAALRLRTVEPLSEQFIQEVRLTCVYIADQLADSRLNRLDYLRQLVAQVDQLIPAERYWGHREMHLDTVALLQGTWHLFDPIPMLEQRTEYIEQVQHLDPLFKGHESLDYAPLLISMEREAGKLNRSDWDDHDIQTDRRALLDRSAQIERCNYLLRLKQDYKQWAEATVGRTALHLGYAIYYGLYGICPCKPCNICGIQDGLQAGLVRAINQLLADDLAGRFSDSQSAAPIAGGTQGCLLYEIPLQGQRAVLKIETGVLAEDPAPTATMSAVPRNVAGCRAMPAALRPRLFASGDYERLPFLLMRHAGVSVREQLIAPLDESLLNKLVAQLREAYASSAIRGPKQVRLFYGHMLDLIEENFTRHIWKQHRFSADDAMDGVNALRDVPARTLPEWCFWTTTDVTVNNIFWDGNRVIFIHRRSPCWASSRSTLVCSPLWSRSILGLRGMTCRRSIHLMSNRTNPTRSACSNWPQTCATKSERRLIAGRSCAWARHAMHIVVPVSRGQRGDWVVRHGGFNARRCPSRSWWQYGSLDVRCDSGRDDAR